MEEREIIHMLLGQLHPLSLIQYLNIFIHILYTPKLKYCYYFFLLFISNKLKPLKIKT